MRWHQVIVSHPCNRAHEFICIITLISSRSHSLSSISGIITSRSAALSTYLCTTPLSIEPTTSWWSLDDARKPSTIFHKSLTWIWEEMSISTYLYRQTEHDLKQTKILPFISSKFKSRILAAMWPVLLCVRIKSSGGLYANNTTEFTLIFSMFN